MLNFAFMLEGYPLDIGESHVPYPQLVIKPYVSVVIFRLKTIYNRDELTTKNNRTRDMAIVSTEHH